MKSSLILIREAFMTPLSTSSLTIAWACLATISNGATELFPMDTTQSARYNMLKNTQDSAIEIFGDFSPTGFLEKMTYNAPAGIGVRQ